MMCPAQVRHKGHEVNDVPLQHLAPDLRTDKSHSVVLHDVDETIIPLRLRGIMSTFPVRKATQSEIDDPTLYRVIEVTSDSQWDPYDDTFDETEQQIRRTLDDIPTAFSRRLEELTRSVSAVTQGRRKGTVSPELMAQRFFVGLETARRTWERTTQLGVRDFSHATGTKRLKHTNYQQRYRRLRATAYTDTLFGPAPALSTKYEAAQCYCTDFGWCKVYPMKSKAMAHYTLDELHKDVGVFAEMKPDNAKEEVAGQFAEKLRRVGTALRPIEPYTYNQNKMEANIRELKRMFRRAMRRSGAPLILWDHCFELMAELRSHTAMDKFELEGKTPVEVLTGDTPDISHLVEFGWYDYVWYIDPPDSIERRKIGRWLGPSHNVGTNMCYKVLTHKGKVISRSSVFPLQLSDIHDETIVKEKEKFEEDLKRVLNHRMAPMPDGNGDNADPEGNETPTFEPYESPEQPKVEVPDDDDVEVESFDKYISARVQLPRGDSMAPGVVKRRVRDDDGKLVGKTNPNPLKDTSLYEVEFVDGTIERYAANQIAENIYEQLDDEGNRYRLVEEIVDYRKNADAVTKDNATVVIRGKEHQRRTTRGWELCVQWKDGSTSWERLAVMKDSYPIEVADYAAAMKLEDEPAFNWWVRTVRKKRDRIIKAVKSRYMRKVQKFGLELPKTVKRALEIDEETKTTHWRDAMKKEIGVIHPAIRILAEGERPPPGYKQIPCHIVLDIKMDFTRKVRFVAGGHVTEPPSSQTYASVVSRESVRIALLIAAYYELDLLAGDIQGAYLNAPCKEKVYFRLGQEFGPQFAPGGEVRFAIVEKALYGLKTSAFAWREALAHTLKDDMGFSSCFADSDVWMRAATRPTDGFQYYEYILVYTDDILIISHRPKELMSRLDQHYLVKPGSIKKPDQYLGAEVQEYRFPDDPGKVRWAMSSSKYVKEAVRNVQAWLKERNRELRKRAATVIPDGYRPELDTTDYCNDDEAHFYMQQIGVLRWIDELGRLDISCEVSKMAAFMAAPRKGHLEALFHLFSYLNQHDRSRMVFDDAKFTITDELDSDWKPFYPDAKDEVPSNAPAPRGKEVQVTAFCDSDHAGDRMTRRSRTGILIYVNKAPVCWYSKKQGTVETSTFGSEFTALKVCTEMLRGLRYKLRMMGIPLDGPAHVRVDNMSVVNNTTKPESRLQKKSNAIAYHYVRENVAAGIIRIGYENTATNLADMLTKSQSGATRSKLVGKVLY